MNSARPKRRIVVIVFLCLMVISFFFIMGEVSAQAKKLALRNASDSFMPLIELATESGGSFEGDYIEAMKSHAEMIQKCVDQMNKRDRDLSFLFRLPPFSKSNITKCLEEVAQDLRKKASSRDEARKKIEQASKSIIQFLTELGLFKEEPVLVFESEVVSEGIQSALKKSLREAHDAAEKYAGDPTVPNAEWACMTNRKAIVYLYLARFGYEEIISQEELIKFHTDINRAIYYNQFLQQTPAIRSGKEVAGSDYELLDKHTDSEIRRLRLLQTIMDSDIQQTQVLLRIALKKAFPDVPF